MEHLSLGGPLPQPVHSTEFDRATAALATSQHGVVTRAQLLALGLSEQQIARRLSAYRLVEVASGIYAVGHGALSRRGRVNAVLLQVGPGNGGVSHVSAARAWDLVPRSRGGDIHVSVMDRRQVVTPPRTQLHRPRTLLPTDLVMLGGFPTTTPERTLTDLLSSSSVVEITRILERMVTVLGRSPDVLHDWAKGARGVRGRPRLDLALDHIVGPAVLRSELEVQFRSLCQLARIPLPETNVRIGPWEVDGLWRSQRLVIELDSYRFHGGRWQFHRDREKGLALAALGYEVLRLTWPQVKHHQARVGEQLRLVLERGGRAALA